MAKKVLSTKDKVLLIVSILLIVVITLGIGVYYLMNARLVEDKTGTVEFTPEVKTPEKVQDKSTNFLVIGVSDDEAERESTQLTDTIMVVNFDFENKKISALQIPRDTYVGEFASLGKINSVYSQTPENWAYSGMQGLIDIIYKTFKINIDHYVAVRMDGFRDLVDAIGGVTMDVPTDMELNGTFVPKGVQTLNGKQAIAVVRTRNVYPTQDIGRLDTQKLFVSAMADKVLQLGPVEMTKIIPIMFKTVSTDLTLNEALKYYNTVADFDLSNMVMMTVPGVPDYVDGYSVYCVYPERTTALINKYFKTHSEPITSDMLEIVDTGTYEPEITPEEMQDVAYLSDLKDGKETEVPYIEENSSMPSEENTSQTDNFSDTEQIN